MIAMATHQCAACVCGNVEVEVGNCQLRRRTERVNGGRRAVLNAALGFEWMNGGPRRANKVIFCVVSACSPVGFSVGLDQRILVYGKRKILFTN